MKKRNLIILLLLLIFIDIYLLIRYYSNAYYINSLNTYLVRSKVGINYDYILYIYLEDESGNYSLTPTVPLEGYVYNRYDCKNNSEIIFNEEEKDILVSLSNKDICSIYFNLSS